MVYLQTDGTIPEQVANIAAALARDARAIVISSNVDDLEGAAGNARQTFVGQGFEPVGGDLAHAHWVNMPAEGPIHVLVGVSGLGQNWSETRALGVTNFLDEMIAANPDRAITCQKIEPGLDLAIVAARVAAYLGA